MMPEAHAIANALNSSAPEPMWEFIARDLKKLINYKGKERIKWIAANL